MASELFLTQCSRWEQINVPFLLSLLHFQTSEGREESKGYCTEETDGQDDSASAVLGQSVEGSVTFLKLGPFALPFSLAKGWIKFQGHSETGKLPPARGKWTGWEMKPATWRPTSLVYFSIHSVTKLPSQSFLLLILGCLPARPGGCKVFKDLFLLSQSFLSSWESRYAHSLL